MTTQRKFTLPAQAGVILLETLVAILIFSLGILALIGLQAAMIGGASDAKYRSEANFIAQQRIGAIWADPVNVNDYLENATDISERLPGGTRSTAQLSPGEFQVTVTWQPPGDPNDIVVHQFVQVARIVGGS